MLVISGSYGDDPLIGLALFKIFEHLFFFKRVDVASRPECKAEHPVFRKLNHIVLILSILRL